jgi:flagellar basal body-associated protein FliL
MNNLFEQKIKEHTNDVFRNEPADGHRERFAAKLASQKKSGRIIKIRKMIVYVAATAAVLAGVVFFTQSPQTHTGNEDSLAEVQNYYAMLFDDKVSEIKVLLEDIDNEDKTTVLNDIEKMKIETVRTLQMTDEESIPFVVGLYSSKIEALEHIQDIFQ